MIIISIIKHSGEGIERSKACAPLAPESTVVKTSSTVEFNMKFFTILIAL